MTVALDPLECRSPEERVGAQFEALRALLARAGARAKGWAHILEGVEPESVDGFAALAALPLLRKSDLVALQAADPPFGGLQTGPVGGKGAGIDRVFVSPGPIYEPGRVAGNGWRFARALRAAGFAESDLILNTFSYHLTPAGAMLEAAARALGAVVIPGGTGGTAQLAAVAAGLRPTGYTGTPDYLKVILDEGDAKGLDLTGFRRAAVTAGALFPSLREEYAERGISCLQCYGTADLGLVAYESEAREGMILDEHVIVEIVRPGTGDPVPEGEVGEVVVTVLDDDYPLFRFATGDLSAFLPGQSPCGRTAPRIGGWMGRADQTTKVRGMFVHPSQVAEIVGRAEGVERIRIVVTRDGERDAMTLHCETAVLTDAVLAERVGGFAQEVLNLRGEVELVAPGSLPNDGLVIVDEREYGEGAS